MRRATLLLLAASRLCAAKPHSFSIHEDVLAHPEFEVVFGSLAISEKDAKLLVQHQAESATKAPQPTTHVDGRGEGDDETPLYIYEIVNMGDYRAICSIPVIEAPPAENKTATELAKAAEAREESRAVASGWELIAALENTCLYYVSGWWSYSFCRNTEIVQYHALASSPKGQPPRRDMHSPEYVLGRVPTIPSHASTTANPADYELDPIPAEVQEKGKQRYLVQKLAGGTICDLTERERTIEVQYHCVPGLQADKISWIKEVTICAYVMVIDTPRLCSDAAFLPPEPTRANAITCNPVSDEPSLLLDAKKQVYNTNEEKNTEAQTGEAAKDAETAEGAAAAASALKELLRGTGDGAKGKRAVVGDINVGSRNILSLGDEAGRAPFKLTPPRSFLSTGLAQEPAKLPAVVVAQGASAEEGGGVESLSREDLKKLDIDPDTVKEMAARVQKLAGDRGWRLEVSDSELAGLRELKGYFDKDEEDDGEPVEDRPKIKTKPKQKQANKEKAAKNPGKATDRKANKVQAQGGEEAEDGPAGGRDPEEAGFDGDWDEAEEEQGSQEEFYRDEL
ncbi:Glucosidase II beta subunit-like protein [Cordyceps fumosorosea ARSEF 2679]|uniref:Endoplasmic reticulum lectin n=1 Tax=Cordyceps fumosorosea (strain ARSEF 2679) TaxID=1081104 RepID=A0A167ZG25_CORFA|nr:Glucosidase II beta subunit-like protein [Cordyceps fumosorosea ARSEF 2679]OAA67473.1 Glucosidase II beta subunit-like protein [Cordyceps fumosorosea ARSEF 2679]